MNTVRLDVTKTKILHKQLGNPLSPSSSLVNLVTLFLIICGLVFLHLQGKELHSSQTSRIIYDNFDFNSNNAILSSLHVPSSNHVAFDASPLTFPGFIENRGQHPDPTLYYYFMHNTYVIGFYESKIQVFARLSRDDPWENLTITYPEALPSLPRGNKRLNSTSNYFNHIPAIVGVENWAEIWYDSLYPGISLRFFADMQTIKYEFFIAPGTDPTKICLDVGDSSLIDMKITSDQVYYTSFTNPNLILWNDISPVAFQDGDTVIQVQFRAIEHLSGGYGFIVGDYDHLLPLVIDPVILRWSSYLGGGRFDYGSDIAVDATGCVYITGVTDSQTFPIINAYDNNTYNRWFTDIFVTKFAADGQSLIYSTYLGGSAGEYAEGISVDAVGCVYVTGVTDSFNFPIVNAYNITRNGEQDIFVTKLASDGQSLIYSTYLGGSNGETGYAICIDATGCAYITGITYSLDFPTVNAFDPTYNGGYEDTFISKLAADGQSLIYSTYIGGSDEDQGNGIAVDSEGCVYIIGTTHSYDFPTFNAYYATPNGYNVFVTKFAADGHSLFYSTFFEGISIQIGNGIAVDVLGCTYITGLTYSAEFPTVNAYDSTYNGDGDVFVTILAVDGQSLIYSSFLGGSTNDRGTGIAVDIDGYVYLTGMTDSLDFPIINAYNTTFNEGTGNVFVTKFDINKQSLIYSTILGSSYIDWENSIAVDVLGCAYVTGHTNSRDFSTVNAYDATFNWGEGDAFVTKLDQDTDVDGIPDGYEKQMGLNVTDPTDAALDTDSDGMPNLWEYQMILNVTDPTDAALDTDSDGLVNLQEFHLGTDARNLDTDEDLMADGWEVNMSLNATDPTDAVLDKDSDGMPNRWEYQMNLNATDPTDALLDTDSDGMPNRWEYQMNLNAIDPIDAFLDKDYDGLSNLLEYQLNTNARNQDTDGDLLPDVWEYQMNLNATNPDDANMDADDDGLSNYWEFLIGTNVHSFDTDGDFLPDGWEYQMNLNATYPLDATLDFDMDGLSNLIEYQFHTNITNPDSDTDLMPDWWEYQMNLNGTNHFDALLDIDDDGLSNLQEYQKGTDPWDSDSDNDKFRDGHDLNPLNFWIPLKYILGSLVVPIILIVGFVYILRQHRILIRQSPGSMLLQVDHRLHDHNYLAAKDVLQRYLRAYNIKVFRVVPPAILYKLLQLVSIFSRYYTAVNLIPAIPELPFITHESLIAEHLDQITTMTETFIVKQCTEFIQTTFNQLKEIRKDLIILAHDLLEYQQIYTTLVSAAPSEDPGQIIASISALLVQLTIFSQKVHERVDLYLPHSDMLQMIAMFRTKIEVFIHELSQATSNLSSTP